MRHATRASSMPPAKRSRKVPSMDVLLVHRGHWKVAIICRSVGCSLRRTVFRLAHNCPARCMARRATRWLWYWSLHNPRLHSLGETLAATLGSRQSCSILFIGTLVFSTLAPSHARASRRLASPCIVAFSSLAPSHSQLYRGLRSRAKDPWGLCCRRKLTFLIGNVKASGRGRLHSRCLSGESRTNASVFVTLLAWAPSYPRHRDALLDRHRDYPRHLQNARPVD
jgi:hypothetical protein